ncbi:hypothetical protein DAI22_01g029500 [Oryza sativa Japonica Group]|nr:hypothetical protein DAI22_01g029500 [Oryza sativa Japonica Group]
MFCITIQDMFYVHIIVGLGGVENEFRQWRRFSIKLLCTCAQNICLGFRNKQGIGKNNMNLAAIEGSGETDGDDKAGVLDLIAA